MQAADEPLDHGSREEAQVRDPREDVRVDEAVQAIASARGVRSMGSSGHGALTPYILDFGVETLSRSWATMRSEVTLSDCAWKLVRMRWRKTGRARAWTSS